MEIRVSSRAIDPIGIFLTFSLLPSLIFQQAIEQSKRYDGLAMQSKNISGQQDLSHFARNTPISANLLRIPKKIFAPPQPPAGEGEESLEYNVSISPRTMHDICESSLVRNATLQDNLPPTFKNELIIEREASLQLRPSLEALRREALDLDVQIRQLQVRAIMMAGNDDDRVLITIERNGVWIHGCY